MKRIPIWLLLCALGLPLAKPVAEESLLPHPRHDYRNVQNIEEMEAALRRSLGEAERYSFSVVGGNGIAQGALCRRRAK